MLGFYPPYFKKMLEIFSFLADISDALVQRWHFFAYQISESEASWQELNGDGCQIK
jgi:hypothetical protein